MELDEKVADGTVTLDVIKSKHPTRTVAMEPFCTKSQVVRYSDNDGNEIASAFRYLRKDNTIGASGKPDPKRVLIGGTIFRVIKEDG